MIATAKCSVLVQAYGNDALRNDCLPHTGSNVMLIAAIAVALIIIGMALLWLTDERRSE